MSSAGASAEHNGLHNLGVPGFPRDAVQVTARTESTSRGRTPRTARIVPR